MYIQMPFLALLGEIFPEWNSPTFLKGGEGVPPIPPEFLYKKNRQSVFDQLPNFFHNFLGLRSGSIMLGSFQCCESNLPMLLRDNYSWSKYLSLHSQRCCVCGGLTSTLLCNISLLSGQLTRGLHSILRFTRCLWRPLWSFDTFSYHTSHLRLLWLFRCFYCSVIWSV